MAATKSEQFEYNENPARAGFLLSGDMTGVFARCIAPVPLSYRRSFLYPYIVGTYHIVLIAWDIKIVRNPIAILHSVPVVNPDDSMCMRIAVLISQSECIKCYIGFRLSNI